MDASPSRNIQLSRTVREQFFEAICATLPEISAAVQDRLTELIDEPAGARENQLRRDVWLAYKKSRSMWVQGIRNAWQAGVHPVAVQGTPSQPVALSFELVNEEVVENKIIASRLVFAISEKAGASFDDLRLRMQRLDGLTELMETDLLRPGTVVMGLVEQWSRSGMPVQSWALVSDTAQRLLILRLKDAYQAANATLVARGVMP